MDFRGAVPLDEYHKNSDVDTSNYAMHHTLGINSNQASPGPHVHDGVNSKFFPGSSIDYVITTDAPSVNNTTTVQNDTQLIYPLEASHTYEIEVFALFQTTVLGHIKTAWAVPAGSTGLKQALGATATAASYTSRTITPVRIGAHGFGTGVVMSLENTGLDQLVWERGIVVTSTTAGNFVYQWAQAIAVAGNLIRDVFSYIKVTKVD